jgi:orotate phosphoribosyltransferase
VKGIFAEKEGDVRVFRRGFSINPGERVLIVDDILTTGSSITEIIEAVKKLKGVIVGIGVLVDRSEQKKDFGVPLFSCLRSATITYPPAECPLCATGIPLVRLGGQT